MRGSATIIVLWLAALAFGAWADPAVAGADPAEALLQQALADRHQAETPDPAGRAMEFYQGGMYTEAITWFDRALQADPNNETLIRHRLTARDRAGTITPVEREELELLERQRHLEVELAVRAVQLRTVRARTLLSRGRHAEALELADELARLISRLPEGVDRDALLEPLRRIADQATGRHTPQQRRTRPQRYLPGVEETLARDAERYLEQGTERRAYKSDEADTLADVGRARRIPRSLLTYPPDWPQITERRKEHADGTIYKGRPFRDQDGQMRYTAVYDLRDLLVEVPDFTDAPQLDLAIVTRSAGDRTALRWRSQIFSGYAEDLAAGVPLLQFFGGVDETRVPPSQRGYNQRYEELMDLIREVLEAGSDN